MPGLIDTHNHLPQMQVIGSYGAQLLDWLNTYTFPVEASFANDTHAQRIAAAYFDEMLRNGTTTTVAYCSVHKHSADAYFAEAERRNMCVIGGKVMMDRNALEAVHDTPQQSYDDSKALIAKWHGKGRAHYAITPRFAITSSPEQMAAAQALVAEFPKCYMQTHLSENRKEIEYTLELYPQDEDYLVGEQEPVRPFHLPVRTRVPSNGREQIGCGFLPDLQPVHRQRPFRRGGNT